MGRILMAGKKDIDILNFIKENEPKGDEDWWNVMKVIEFINDWDMPEGSDIWVEAPGLGSYTFNGNENKERAIGHIFEKCELYDWRIFDVDFDTDKYRTMETLVIWLCRKEECWPAKILEGVGLRKP